MAKKSAAQVEQAQRDIPEAHRAAMRLTDDGANVIVTFTLPRVIAIAIRKNHSIEIDVSRIAGAARLFSVFMYGLGREMRDGATTRESVKNEAGEVVDRPLSDTQKVDFAISHAEMRRDWLYGDREKQTRGGVDVFVQETRRVFVSYLVKTMGMTAKTVPSDIARATTTLAIYQAAMRAGVSKKASEALAKRANAIARLRADEIEIDIE